MGREHLNRKGRKPGTRNKVPRTAKRIIESLFESFGSDEALLSRAIQAGLQAKPPISLGYLKLVTEYHTGLPDQTVRGVTKVVHEHVHDQR